MPSPVNTAYQSSVHKPADFTAFWRDVIQQAAAIPLEPELVRDPLRSTDDVEVFEVFYTSLDHVRLAAWYCRPTRRTDPSPAILLTPGYQMEPPIPKDWARKGYCTLSVAPRGKLRSNRQFNPGYPNLLTHNIIDKHTYSYRGFYVDAWRGVDFCWPAPKSIRSASASLAVARAAGSLSPPPPCARKSALRRPGRRICAALWTPVP